MNEDFADAASAIGELSGAADVWIKIPGSTQVVDALKALTLKAIDKAESALEPKRKQQR